MFKRKQEDITTQDDDVTSDDEVIELKIQKRPRRVSDVIDSMGDRELPPYHRRPEDEALPDQGYSATPESVDIFIPDWLLRQPDILDATLNRNHTATGSSVQMAKMSTTKGAHCYNMNHKNRGKCVVFNHEIFDTGFDNREGSIHDAKRIEKTFKNLDFTVEILDNLKHNEILEKIEALNCDSRVITYKVRSRTGFQPMKHNIIFDKQKITKGEDLAKTHVERVVELHAIGACKLIRTNCVRSMKFMKPPFSVQLELNDSRTATHTSCSCVSGRAGKLQQEDHSESDCICIFVLTHGLNNDLICAKDVAYSSDNIWKPFTADKCTSLAGKPKIFFIQACRGDKLDSGIVLQRSAVRTETDSAVASYKIPTHADFLIAHSTVQGFFSWRNPEEGTWYIKCLCEIIDEYADSTDLVKMLTMTARKVATEYESFHDLDPAKHEQKQVPSITSMLIRELHFSKKSCT